MAELPARDLESVLDFVDEAHSHEDPASFRTGILPGLAELVPCNLVGYNEVYADGREALVITHPEPLDTGELLAQLAHQHPLIAVQANGDERAYMISDFLSEREFHGLDLYADLYRLIEAEDQIAFGLPGPVVIGIAMNRDSRSFSERDRALLDLLRPHLAHAYSRALERARSEELIAALEGGLRESSRAVLALDADGAIAAASGEALALLHAYFPGGRGLSLPPLVAEWLAVAPPHGPAPLRADGERGRLTLREAATSGPGALLLLEEERIAKPEALQTLGLTRRQSDVLHLLALGRSTDEIAADLFISRQTVRKHLEHVYSRLGVTSRDEAVAKAREVARGSGSSRA